MDHLDHIPVLLNESIQALNIKPHGIYVDATFGRGGHSKLILEHLHNSGKLLVIDQDPTAIEYAKKLALLDNRIIVCQGSYSHLDEFLKANNIDHLDGILFDLGVSSPQLDDGLRGFSFSKDGPLDMRMDNSERSGCKYTAEEWIDKAKEQEIADVLWAYGEERFSRKIAKAIVTQRSQIKITSTLQLAEIIKAAHPKWPKHKHPATQSFLAIRLFINQELEILQKTLDLVLTYLRSGSRLVVISFHSLEDRIVKTFMKLKSGEQNNNNVLNKLPLTKAELESLKKNQSQLKIVHKPLKAGIIEGEQNIRARSAILRVAEKI